MLEIFILMVSSRSPMPQTVSPHRANLRKDCPPSPSVSAPVSAAGREIFLDGCTENEFTMRVETI